MELVPILIYLLGLALIFLELFVPSGGILGIVGTLCSLYGIWQTFAYHFLLGIATIGATLLYAVIVFRLWKKRVTFTGTLAGAESTPEGTIPRDLVGQEGQTVTVLRPAGFAEIGGVKYPVVTNGSFVAAGTRVKVIELVGNRIVVTPLDDTEKKKAEDYD